MLSDPIREMVEKSMETSPTKQSSANKAAVVITERIGSG